MEIAWPKGKAWCCHPISMNKWDFARLAWKSSTKSLNLRCFCFNQIKHQGLLSLRCVSPRSWFSKERPFIHAEKPHGSFASPLFTQLCAGRKMFYEFLAAVILNGMNEKGLATNKRVKRSAWCQIVNFMWNWNSFKVSLKCTDGSFRLMNSIISSFWRLNWIIIE